MPSVIKYVLTTGQLIGVWEANTTAMLLPQIVEGDDTYGYLLREEPAPRPQDQWWVQDGELVHAGELRIVPDVFSFAADGVAACTLTVSPFVPCTLLVNGVPWSLVPEDPALVLTSDVPQTFQVRLAPLAGYWASPITVEAV